MREIVCPHCSKTFNLDDAGYAAILKQVRDSDFDQQLHDRLEVAEREKTNELQIATMKITADKETIIQELKAKIANDEISRQLAVSETKTTLKEQYEAQIRDRDLEIERLRDHKAKLSTKMVGETAAVFFLSLFVCLLSSFSLSYLRTAASPRRRSL